MLQVINANVVGLGGGKHRKIKPYPRPGKDKDTERKIGKGTSMSLAELREWIRSKQNGR